jgi:general nucleoside transport system permease protein
VKLSGIGSVPRTATKPRLSLSTLWKVLIPFWSIVAALLIAAGMIAILGKNPVQAFQALADGSIGSQYNIAVTLTRATPYLFTGLAVAFAYRCGVFNIGAEGQLQFGAAAATFVGAYCQWLPGPTLVVACIVAGFVAGGVWGLIPGILKARWGLSEIITTIMFNYIAINFVYYLLNGPMAAPNAVFPQSERIAAWAQLPFIWPGTRLHAGFLIGIVAAVAVYLILKRTTLGYSIRVVGFNPLAARHAGISVGRNIMLVMLISGGLAGVAGAVTIMGVYFSLMMNFSPGWGYTSIVVALLGQANPFGVIAASVFFGGLEAGAQTMQRAVGVPAALVYVIQTLPVLFIAGTTARQLIRKSAKRKEEARVGSTEPAPRS